jgi:branched-chain amino acid transport system permease protein
MARATRAKTSYEKSRVHALGSQVAKLVPAAAVAGAERSRFALRRTEVIAVALFGLTALTPFLLSSDGNAMSSATLIVLSAIGAVGLGLVMGLAGQFSLGQAAFYLLSGYAVAILTTKHGWAPLPALAVGTALAIAGGLVIGWLTLRLKGFNLAIATLAITLIMLVVVVQADSLTGGPLGLIGVPPLTILGVDLSGPKGFFWTALVVLAVSLLLARNIKRSRIGRALSAIGADEEGGQALGLDPFKLKLLIFTVGAGMAGIAGGLWAFYLQLAAPENWDFNLTISLVTYVVVGGVASIWGPFVGAIVVGGLQYYVRFHAPSTAGASDYEVIMNGALLVLCILLFRDGLAVTFSLERIGEWIRRRRGVAAPASPPAADVPPVHMSQARPGDPT